MILEIGDLLPEMTAAHLGAMTAHLGAMIAGTIAETTDEMIAVISVEMIVEMIARVEE